MDTLNNSLPPLDAVATLWDAVDQAWSEAGDPTPAQIEESSILRGSRLPSGTVDDWRRKKRVPDWEKFEILIRCLSAEKKRDWKSLHAAAEAERNRCQRSRGQSAKSDAGEDNQSTDGPTVAAEKKSRRWKYVATAAGTAVAAAGIAITISLSASDQPSADDEPGARSSSVENSRARSTSSDYPRTAETMRIANTTNDRGTPIGVCASKSPVTSLKGHCHDEGFLVNVVCRKSDGAERVDPRTQRKTTGWVKIDHDEWIPDLYLEPRSPSAGRLEDLPDCS